MARKNKCSSFPLNILKTAGIRQAYAAGKRRGTMGCRDNPFPKGTHKHVAWANGCAAGMAGRVR